MSKQLDSFLVISSMEKPTIRSQAGLNNIIFRSLSKINTPSFRYRNAISCKLSLFSIMIVISNSLKRYGTFFTYQVKTNFPKQQ
jgi:hypothetical protein